MRARRKKPVQLALDLRASRRGGARPGAGRKPRADRVGMLPHVARPKHVARHPVHVTARAVGASPNLRSQRIFTALRALFTRSSEKGFRLVHFSVQANHVHLIVEAEEGVMLARGVQRLLSRIAHVVNAIARRSGRLWRDRYHRDDLKTPSQVRNAYVYVLFNVRRHALHRAYFTEPELAMLDACSSAAWFAGWAPRAGPSEEEVAGAGPPIVARAESWLASVGWKRRGLLRVWEVPRGRASTPRPRPRPRPLPRSSSRRATSASR